MRRTALRSTAGGALAVLALMAATTQAEAKVADRGWSASNSFARGSGYIDENNNGFSVSGSVTDYVSNPSTSYVYVSWQEYNHGAWTTFNRQASGHATNSSTAGISLSRTTPYDVRRIQVTVCTSAGNATGTAAAPVNTARPWPLRQQNGRALPEETGHGCPTGSSSSRVPATGTPDEVLDDVREYVIEHLGTLILTLVSGYVSLAVLVDPTRCLARSPAARRWPDTKRSQGLDTGARVGT
ncbi:hypothetical protein AB0D12_36665 [Streptomyces sp. NPDC048479]|uniref:hypothetical protein n=1 Tax=Streptomyces sp. NPDC048479 TaxID=3154725 RepID=UPI00341B21BA